MAFDGTFVHEKSENLDGFLKTMGVKPDLIQKILAAKPTKTLKQDGDTLHVTTSAPGHPEIVNEIKLGTPSPYKLPGGCEMEVDLTIDGNTAKGTMKKGNQTGNLTLEVDDTHLKEEVEIGGKTFKNTFKKT